MGLLYFSHLAFGLSLAFCCFLCIYKKERLAGALVDGWMERGGLVWFLVGWLSIWAKIRTWLGFDYELKFGRLVC